MVLKAGSTLCFVLILFVLPMRGDNHLAFLSVQPKSVPQPFDFSQTYQQDIFTNQQHIYVLQLSSQQYMRLGFDLEGTDLAVAAFSPNNRKIVELEYREGGNKTFSLFIEHEGLHRIEVRSLEKTQTRGAYRVKVVEKRTAIVSDHQRIAAERAFLEGERLQAQNELEANKEAIKQYELARIHWNAAGDKHQSARAIKASGEVHYLLGEPRQALAHYQQALSDVLSVPSPELEIELRIALSYVYVHLGDYKKAMNQATQANSLSERMNNARLQAQALVGLGEVYYAFGDRWKTLEYATAAKPLWESIGDRRAVAIGMLTLGYLYTDVGQTNDATKCLDQALAIYKTVSDKRGQALAMAAIATLKANLGQSQQALDLYTESLGVFQTAGDRFWEASVLHNIGSVYQDLGQDDKALGHYNKALIQWQGIERPDYVAASFSVIGWLYYLKDRSQQNLQQSLKNLQQAFSISKKIADKKYQANALRKLGAVYSSLGDKKKALAHYRKALKLHRGDGGQQGISIALREIGKFYGSLRRVRQARSFLKEALALNRNRGDRVAESETLYQLAGVEADGGNLTQARANIEDALKIGEELRSNVVSHQLRVTYFASIQRYFEFFLRLMWRQHLQNPTAGFDAEALAVNERARARSLLELLTEAGAKIREGADALLLEQALTLQKRIGELAERKDQLLKLEAPVSELTALSQELDALISQREQVEAAIKLKSPRYASLTQPQPISTREIQQMLGKDTLLIEFVLGDEQSYVWAVTSTGLKGEQLAGRARIEQAAKDLYRVLAPGESAPVQLDKQRMAEFQAKANQLSQLILEPVAKELGQKRLVIVADGLLQYIPFGALPKPQTDKKQQAGNGTTAETAAYIPLIQEHEIVSLPSASTLAILRQETPGRKPAPKAIAVLADPVFETSDLRLLAVNGQVNGAVPNQAAMGDMTSQLRNQSVTRSGIFKRLHGTLDEATAIEELTKPEDRFIAKGFDATLQQATNRSLSQYRIIHFATHGVLDDENPELSALVFSLFDKQGKSQQGRLWLHDIYNLNLPAELVVLSACDTGLGKEFKGEGLVGLTRGFMYAGAPRVMASLWKVEDKPTAKLMRRFYWHLLKMGLPPAAALRQAQLDLSKDPDWNAPYYWGSFVLQGEWR